MIQRPHLSNAWKIRGVVVPVLVMTWGLAQAADPAPAAAPNENLFAMSLDDLMNMEVVSASKKAEGIKDAPSNITVITAKQIKEWGMRDLKDVMRRIAGYYVVADRDEWVFAARGNVADNDQKYLILIDGHKMNSDENFGPGNIIELPNDLSNVKQIEIIKGPGSVMWGSGGLAGVINVITKNADDLGEHGVHTSVSMGVHDTYKANFQMGEKVSDDADWIVMGAVTPRAGGVFVEQAASGGFSYIPTGELLTGYGDPRGYYTTALDRYDTSYMLQLKGHIKDLKINAFVQDSAVFNRQWEVDRGRENYLTSLKYFAEGTYEKTLGKDTDFTWKISAGQNRQEYMPVAISPDVNSVPNTVTQTDIEWLDHYFQTSADIVKPVGERFTLNAGADFAWTTFGPSHRLNGFDADPNHVTRNTTGMWFDAYAKDENMGAYAMGTYAVNEAKTVKLVAGSRFDYNAGRGSPAFNASPRIGAIWHQAKDSTFKLLYNRGFLRPANFQLKGGNVDSELMDQVDLIWLKQFGRLNLTATGYWQKLTGFIIILANQSQFVSAGDYESKGAELELSTPLGEAHTLWANASYAQAEGKNFLPLAQVSANNRRVDADGKLLNYPELMGNIGATFRFLDKKLFVSPAVRYAGIVTYRTRSPATEGTEITNYYTDDIGPFTYVDLSIGYEPTSRFGVYLNFNNLLDEDGATHQSVWNGTIGQYGRYMEVKAAYKFK